MLILAIACIGLIALLGVLAIDAQLIITAQQKLQANTDSLCLSIALELNKDDKVGKINNLVVDSRQLADTSRQCAEICEEQNLSITPLAYQLNYEDGLGAQIVDNERKRITSLTIQHVYKLLEKASNSLQIEQCSLGYTGNNLSNVKAQRINESLLKADQESTFFDRESNLYKAKIDLKIKGQPKAVSFLCSPIRQAPENKINPASLCETDIIDNATPILQSDKSIPATFYYQPTFVKITTSQIVHPPFMIADDVLHGTSAAVSNTTGPWICNEGD